MPEKKTGMLKRLANFFAPKRKKIKSDASIPKSNVKVRDDAAPTSSVPLRTYMRMKAEDPNQMFGESLQRRKPGMHSQKKQKQNRLNTSRKTKLRHKRLRKSA